MNITVVGAGYVGLVMTAGLAELGHTVYCIEVDTAKREALQSGECPIYEPELEDTIRKGLRDERIQFSAKLGEPLNECELVFVAVGTPSSENGSADISAVLNVAYEIGQVVSRPLVIAVKSTVPVGTCNTIENIIRDRLKIRELSIDCHVVSNPEFLREGNALNDFRSPDRVVVGSSSTIATEIVMRAYKQLLRNHSRFVIVSRESAELGKYASNAMLASRISLMNELSLLAEPIGADIEEVRSIVGSDQRIGRHYLYAGPGFGGSCFPKDLKALATVAKDFDVRAELINAIINVNEHQKSIVGHKLIAKLGQVSGKKIAIWGLSFKPNTDDIRESPALDLIQFLLANKALITAYDPAVKSTNSALDSQIEFASSAYAATINADALVLVTEWKEFRNPDFSRLSSIMRGNVIVDARNIWNRTEISEFGFVYSGIGRA